MAKIEFRLSIAAVVLALLAILAALIAIDLRLTRTEWNRHHSVQRVRAEVEYPDLAPRNAKSLSRNFGLARIKFDTDAELSIPTWYNASLFMIASVLFVAAGLRTHAVGLRSRFRPLWRLDPAAWILVAIALFYLSADEGTQLHELLGGGEGTIGADLNRWVGVPSFITFNWVVPAVLGILIGLPLLIPWFIRLPWLSKGLFILAGFIWLSGAVGLETYQGDYIKTHSIDSWNYHVLSTTEETLEMLGLIFLIGSVLLHFRLFMQDAPVPAPRLADSIPFPAAGPPPEERAPAVALPVPVAQAAAPPEPREPEGPPSVPTQAPAD